MQPHHCVCPGQMELSAQGGISELVQTPDFTKACKIGLVFSRTAAGTPPIKCLLQSVKGSEEFLREKLLELFNLAGECYFCCPHPRKGQVIVDIN